MLFDRVFPYLSESVRDPKSATLAKALRYIEKHPDFRVPELATHCSISESGLYALFQQYASATPLEIKNKMKIDRAITLLQTTNLSIEEISEKLGFCNAAYFRKVMKDCTGKTPSAHRLESGLI